MENDDFSVPDDFPRPQVLGAVGGFQPKLLLVSYAGKFYAPGCTPPELFSRWELCEDLAQQFVGTARETKAGKRAHMSEQAILDQYCLRSMKMNWGSDDEMRWVFRRAATLLDWPVPPSAVADGA
jgi:hypothetical protein